MLTVHADLCVVHERGSAKAKRLDTADGRFWLCLSGVQPPGTGATSRQRKKKEKERHRYRSLISPTDPLRNCERVKQCACRIPQNLKESLDCEYVVPYSVLSD